MSTPKLNETLLDATLEHIVANKKRWQQGNWRYITPKLQAKLNRARLGINAGKLVVPAIDPNDDACGTAMCFAGWAATLDHGRWVQSDQALVASIARGNGYSDDLYARKNERGSYFDDARGKRTISIRDRARNALGLTDEEADTLFAGHNTLADLRRKIKEIKAGEYR